MQAGGTVTAADNILAYSPVTGWTTYFVYDAGGGVHRWVDSADNTLADQGKTCLSACQGVYFHRRGAAIDLPFTGIVRENDFACPLPQGCSLVGSGYPVQQSFGSRVMTEANGFTGNGDIRKADQVQFWQGDNDPNHLCYVAHFLLDGGPSYRYWVSSDDAQVSNENALPLFAPTRAAFYCEQQSVPNWLISQQWGALTE